MRRICSFLRDLLGKQASKQVSNRLDQNDDELAHHSQFCVRSNLPIGSLPHLALMRSVTTIIRRRANAPPAISDNNALTRSRLCRTGTNVARAATAFLPVFHDLGRDKERVAKPVSL
jgi:hypothetical protein